MMRRALLTTVLVAAAVAPAAEARCRPVLRDGDLALGRTAKGWVFCGRGGAVVTATGRPVGLRSYGEVAVVRFRERGRTTVHLVQTRGRFPLDERFVLLRRERVARHVFVPDEYGFGELYFAVTGRRPYVAGVGLHPPGVLDRTRGLAPGSLRVRGREVQWRIRGRWRRIGLDGGGEVPPADCTVPPWARSVLRDGTAVTYELRLGHFDFAGVVFGCAGAGPPRSLAGTSTEIGTGSDSRPRAIREPFAVLEISGGWKESFTFLSVHDLRTGETRARGRLAGRGAFLAAVISPSGALGYAQRTGDRQEVLAARGEEAEVLDAGPAVDGRSLRLDGTTLSWRSGGATRTAELP